MLKYNEYRNYFYFSSKYFTKLINKFILKGKRTRIEYTFNIFFQLVKKKKTFFFFFSYLEALYVLKPLIGAKVWKFAKNKRIRKRKKGVKFQIRVKIIPTNISELAKAKQALKWLFLKIKKNNMPLQKSILTEVLAVVKRKKTSALQDKKQFQNLVIQNRGVRHYRW